VAHLRTCAACDFPHEFDLTQAEKPRFTPISLRTSRGKILPLARNCLGQNYLCHQAPPPAQNRDRHCFRPLFQARRRNAYPIRAMGSVREGTSLLTGDGGILEVAGAWVQAGGGRLANCSRRGEREIPDLNDGCQSAACPIRTQKPRSPCAPTSRLRRPQVGSVTNAAWPRVRSP
jgi:hypothetical protein